MINIDVDKLEHLILQDIMDAYLKKELNCSFSNLDRNDRQIMVARMWTSAVLEVLNRNSSKSTKDSK